MTQDGVDSAERPWEKELGQAKATSKAPHSPFLNLSNLWLLEVSLVTAGSQKGSEFSGWLPFCSGRKQSFWGEWLSVPLALLEYSCSFFCPLHCSVFPVGLSPGAETLAPLGEGQTLLLLGGTAWFCLIASEEWCPGWRSRRRGETVGWMLKLSCGPFEKWKEDLWCHLSTGKWMEVPRCVNSMFEVGGYGNKWGPWRCHCWRWGSPLLTGVIPKPPPFSLSSNGHSLSLCWVCHSVLSTAKCWLIICIYKGECHHGEKKSFMWVSWKNETMKNEKAIYFGVQFSHALNYWEQPICMWLPHILCPLWISPHLELSSQSKWKYQTFSCGRVWLFVTPWL